MLLVVGVPIIIMGLTQMAWMAKSIKIVEASVNIWPKTHVQMSVAFLKQKLNLYLYKLFPIFIYLMAKTEIQSDLFTFCN